MISDGGNADDSLGSLYFDASYLNFEAGILLFSSLFIFLSTIHPFSVSLINYFSLFEWYISIGVTQVNAHIFNVNSFRVSSDATFRSVTNVGSLRIDSYSDYHVIFKGDVNSDEGGSLTLGTTDQQATKKGIAFTPYQTVSIMKSFELSRSSISPSRPSLSIL